MYLNMPTSTTVQAIGLKKVYIRIQGKENWRMIEILTILGFRKRLHLLIFKVKEGKIQKRKLQQIECKKEKEFCILTRKSMEKW